jgi:NAD-dependent dihydropyrimidine dehydrogenase PreA subunit
MPPTIDEKKCTGCGTCYRNCPGDLIAMNKKRKKAQVVYPDECWHCGVCRMDCPEEAIKIVFPLEML